MWMSLMRSLSGAETARLSGCWWPLWGRCLFSCCAVCLCQGRRRPPCWETPCRYPDSHLINTRRQEWTLCHGLGKKPTFPNTSGWLVNTWQTVSKAGFYLGLILSLKTSLMSDGWVGWPTIQIKMAAPSPLPPTVEKLSQNIPDTNAAIWWLQLEPELAQ